jgi:hypothetical protein
VPIPLSIKVKVFISLKQIKTSDTMAETKVTLKKQKLDMDMGDVHISASYEPKPSGSILELTAWNVLKISRGKADPKDMLKCEIVPIIKSDTNSRCISIDIESKKGWKRLSGLAYEMVEPSPLDFTLKKEFDRLFEMFSKEPEKHGMHVRVEEMIGTYMSHTHRIAEEIKSLDLSSTLFALGMMQRVKDELHYGVGHSFERIVWLRRKEKK